MSGVIYQFGQTTLPHHAPRWDRSAQAANRLVKVVGGVYDPDRTDDAPLDLPYQITVSALALETTNSLMGASLDDYRAMLRKRDRLWMNPYDVTVGDRWCWARLIRIGDVGSYKDRIWQPVDLVFQALSGWNGSAHGGGWAFDAGYYFDNGLYFDAGEATLMTGFTQVINIPNAGNRAVTNAGIVVDQSNKEVTSVRVVTTYNDFTYTGSVAAGDQLIIDCGSRTVTDDGTGDYDGFALNSGHASSNWLDIPAGGVNATVTMAWSGQGANPSITFVYSDGWI